MRYSLLFSISDEKRTEIELLGENMVSFLVSLMAVSFISFFPK